MYLKGGMPMDTDKKAETKKKELKISADKAGAN